MAKTEELVKQGIREGHFNDTHGLHPLLERYRKAVLKEVREIIKDEVMPVGRPVEEEPNEQGRNWWWKRAGNNEGLEKVLSTLEKMGDDL